MGLHVLRQPLVMFMRSHSKHECDPSKEDIDTTNKITQALKYVGAYVLDHTSLGRARQDCSSFARAEIAYGNGSSVGFHGAIGVRCLHLNPFLCPAGTITGMRGDTDAHSCR